MISRWLKEVKGSKTHCVNCFAGIILWLFRYPHGAWYFSNCHIRTYYAGLEMCYYMYIHYSVNTTCAPISSGIPWNIPQVICIIYFLVYALVFQYTFMFTLSSWLIQNHWSNILCGLSTSIYTLYSTDLCAIFWWRFFNELEFLYMLIQIESVFPITVCIDTSVRILNYNASRNRI